MFARSRLPVGSLVLCASAMAQPTLRPPESGLGSFPQVSSLSDAGPPALAWAQPTVSPFALVSASGATVAPGAGVDASSADRLREVLTGTLGHFHVGSTVEFEGSTITIPIRASLPNGWISTEEVDLQAFMRLELGRRVRNQLGRNQFEFNIAVWELFGRSELLSEKFGTDVFITFSLTPPPQKQPRSICFANQEGPDFPATIIYSACYDVYINKDKVIDGQMGVAICTPIVSIPPRNVLVAFEKPFEDRKRGIAFDRGCCWGMKTITPEDFMKGVNRAREIRGWSSRKDPHGDLFGE